MSEATLSLTYSITKIGTSWKLAMLAAATVMPAEVFAIEVVPLTATGSEATERFSHVCNLVELINFPDAKTGDSAYYRVDELEMLFDSHYLMDQSLTTILANMTKLKRDYNNMQNIARTPDVSHTVTL